MNPDDVIDASGVVGDPILNEETGEPVTYEDYYQQPQAAPPASQTVQEIGSYDDDYQLVPDPIFLKASDEWLAETRQVRSNF